MSKIARFNSIIVAFNKIKKSPNSPQTATEN